MYLKVFGSAGATGIKICIALSTFGNLIAVVYTTAKGTYSLKTKMYIGY
jgi:hypothetical protein